MDNLERFLVYAVPLVAIAISYIFGRLESRASSKKAVALERYQKFYIPFIRHFYDFHMETVPYEVWIADVAESLSSLIMQNLEYLDKASIALVPEFSIASRLLFEDANDISEFIQTFNKLTNCVLLESIKLSRLLHLPPLGIAALAIFDRLSCDSQQKSLPEGH